MLQNVSLTPSRRTLEFGIYRDGDNNLDHQKALLVNQAGSPLRARTRAGVEDPRREIRELSRANDYLRV